MNARATLFLVILPALVQIGLFPTRAQAQGEAPRNDSINKDELRADLNFLASDEMRGRRTGSPESLLAAAYIRSQFERLGLKPAASDGSYYQRYNLMSATLGEENLLDISQGDNASIRLRPGQDYYPLRFSASGQVRGPVVYAGFGISAPNLSYDDYRGDEVKGKIVLVLDHEPGERDPESPFEGVVSAEASQPYRKALFAQEKGAVGILFVQDVHNHPGPSNFEATANRNWPETPTSRPRFTLARWMEKMRIPAAQISPALAEILVRGTGRTLLELARAAETERGMTSLPVPGVEVELTTSVNRHIFTDRNVVGLIEGGDDSVKDEWVILCAHYDHTGADGNRVFNGADDDGSGIVALFEIAEAYSMAARQGQRPRRSILFAAWNSEEMGLLGSWAYTLDPLTPLDKTVAVLNMDMIGRNQEVPEGGGRRFRGFEVQTADSNRNTVHIFCHSYSTDLMGEVEEANQAFGLELLTGYDNNISSIKRRSDQWPFLQNDVPAFLFSTGLHPDYHTEDDLPERINYDKLEKIVRLVHQLSWTLAVQDERPSLNERR